MSAVLQIDDLHIDIDTPRGVVRALQGISFSLEKGQTLGIVGESGSGKSVLGLSILRLLPQPPARHAGGSIEVLGKSVLGASAKQMRALRGGRVAMIFQDPMTALNPYMRIGVQLQEAVLAHQPVSGAAARAQCAAMLTHVGLHDADLRLRQYPHELSGGMRQRVVIAMALLNRPELVIADEPTTALDVTVAQQILQLLRALQQELHMAMILVSHDLHVVAQSAAAIVVMYAGRIVEKLTPRRLSQASHPYTQGLLRCAPTLGMPKTQRLAPIPGNPPNPIELPPGCPFWPRCRLATEQCRGAMPPEEIVADDHSVRCWHHDK